MPPVATPTRRLSEAQDTSVVPPGPIPGDATVPVGVTEASGEHLGYLSPSIPPLPRRHPSWAGRPTPGPQCSSVTPTGHFWEASLCTPPNPHHSPWREGRQCPAVSEGKLRPGESGDCLRSV